VLLTRRALAVSLLLPQYARAQSSESILFVPEGPPPSTAKGRSADRERDPKAWGIGDEQWARFQDFAIATHRKLKVSIRLNNLRSRQFKEDLVELMASIPGWDIDDQGTYTAGTLPSFDGILIQNLSMFDPSPDAMFIAQALDAAGIEPTAIFDSAQPGHLRVVIGAPPEK
jgi:hypothetical protein